MFTFTPEVDAVLRRCGWSPERHVPTEHWITALVEEGFTPFPLTLQILENLGGLPIVPVKRVGSIWSPTAFTVDPLELPASPWERQR